MRNRPKPDPRYRRDPWHRFWAKVVQGPSGCLLWTGATNDQGYGQLRVQGKLVYAHRWIFEQVNGPLPEGWDPDHLCKVHGCVSTEHLEGVPHAVNLARGDSPSARRAREGHCVRGHDLAEAYVTKAGRRQCRRCKNERRRKQPSTT